MRACERAYHVMRTAVVFVIELPPLNVTAPSAMYTAPPLPFCTANHPLRAVPAHRPPCARPRGHTAAMVPEIATPSNTSPPFSMYIAPPEEP